MLDSTIIGPNDAKDAVRSRLHAGGFPIRRHIINAAFLLALMLYILVGVQLTPFHGDESMQISMAHDFFYMLRGEWNRIAYTPPVYWNSEQYLRLINGTIN